MTRGVLDTQIHTLYESLDTPVEDIAVSLEISVAEVKYSLANNSAKYRKLVRDIKAGGEVNREDVTEEESEEMLHIIKQVAREAAEPNDKLKAAMFVYNERKGRNDPAHNKIGSALSLQDINLALKDALQHSSAFIQYVEQNSKTIDILPPAMKQVQEVVTK